MGQIQSLDEFLSLLSRRRWLIIAVTVLGLLAAMLYAVSRADTYESAAVIQIEMPTVVEQGGDRVQSGAAHLLQAIEQRLTTRENLLAVADRHDLYAGLTDDQKVTLLRSSLTFQSVASATEPGVDGRPSISAIIVFARMDSAELAARIANDFAQGILDQSTAGQLVSARETSAFYAEEESRVWQQIVALEAEIAAFKNANSASLPARRDAQRDEMMALDTDLRALAQQRVALEGQRDAIGSRDSLRATELRALDDLETQLQVLTAQADNLQSRRAEILLVQAQTPEVDRVLSGYDRRLGQLQGQYDVVTRSLAEATTAQRLAEARQSERFTLLERATTPQFATGGGGQKLVLAGAVVSLIGGIALAFLLDLLNPVVRTADQMHRQLDLLPVISIPEVTPAARARLRARPQVAAFGKMLDDPAKPILGLPRFAVLAGLATLLLLAAAAALA